MWVMIIMALISYFSAKKSGASNGTAAAVAGVAALGTYAVANYTDWGKENIGTIGGTDSGATSGAPTAGSTTTSPGGITVPTTGSTTIGSGLLGTATSTLASALPALAAGAATAAVATSKIPGWAWFVGGFLIFKWAVK